LHNKIIQKRLNRELIEKIEKQIEENRRKKKLQTRNFLKPFSHQTQADDESIGERLYVEDPRLGSSGV
jgi:hypothetical protein